MIKGIARILIVFGFLLIATGGFANPLLAAPGGATPAPSTGAPQFNIYPVGKYPSGYFEITLKPGESADHSVGVVNSGKLSAALRLFAANATNPPNGGFAAGDEGDTPIAPTNWLALPGTSFDLPAGAKREFPFKISVPKDAAAGQYVAALVATTSESVEVPGTTMLRQFIRSAISVVITVPGRSNPSFEFSNVVINGEHSIQMLDISIENKGNLLVKPAGTIIVATPEGKPVVNAPIQMGSVYAGRKTIIQLPLPEQMKPGDYVVSGTLTDKATGAAAEIPKTTITLKDRNQKPPAFSVDPLSVKANGSPIQYADVSATVNNAGQPIPTAKVTLKVARDGKPVEDYVLVNGQALATGKTTITQRYIPAGGWQKGTWSFQLVIAAVDQQGTETVIATVDVPDKIVVP